MLRDDFMQKVIPEPMSGCWLWTGAITADGYGRFYDKRTHSAHRYSYQKLVGEIPQGLHVDHKCRQRSCVNPDHLEPVTQAENTRRGIGAQRTREFCAKITHCKRGHELSGKNLRLQNLRQNGKVYVSRACKICYNALKMEKYYKKKALKKALGDV